MKLKLKKILYKNKSDSEANIQSAVLAILKRKKIIHWRQSLGGVHTGRTINGVPVFRKNPMKGFPDIGGIISIGGLGVLWVMEIKSKKGILSADQKKWLKALSASGVICAVIYSIKEAAEFISYLEEIESQSKEGFDYVVRTGIKIHCSAHRYLDHSENHRAHCRDSGQRKKAGGGNSPE